jgi:hypothetical protein
LCVKHYYYTIFGVPKKLTHSGIVFIQTLNQIAIRSIFILFQSDQPTEGIREEKWEVFYPNALGCHRILPATDLGDVSQKTPAHGLLRRRPGKKLRIILVNVS